MPDQIRLVVRGDDAGSCHSANQAILEACQCGLLRNVSIMVPGPAFEEASALLANLPDVALGLHVTLNAEWEGPRWGPVLPVAQVPSLVDTNGMFTHSPLDLHNRKANVEEMVAEVQAQLAKARAYGLQIDYLDEHMGVGWQSGLRERLAELAAREGLLDAESLILNSLPRPAVPTGDLVTDWIASVAAASPGDYLLVTHPGMDTPEMQDFYTAGESPGSVAQARDTERRALCSDDLRVDWHQGGVKLMRYLDLGTIVPEKALYE